MPNATGGFFSRFRRQPVAVNNANKNLERNVGIYVQSYLKNRNKPNKVPPINNYMAKALHKYINTKRARVAGAAAAAAGNAGAPAPVQAAVASNVVNTPPSATPSNAGNNAANAAKRAGATPLQITAAAAGAAQQQAIGQNRGPNAAQQAGAEAAAQAAQQARPNASATQQAQTANAGAAAAGLSAPAAANAANLAYLNSLGNSLNTNTILKVQKMVNEPFSSNAVKKKALEVLNRLKKPNERVNLLKTLTNLNTNAKVNAAIKEIRGRNPNANWKNTKANGLTNGQKKVLNGLKMGKNYAGLVRQKAPNVNVNLGNTGLFKQAQTQRPAQAQAQAQEPKTNNRNVNAIRAKLNGPNMTPGEWYRYAATLGYNTGKYANEANRLFTGGTAADQAALKKLITKSLLSVHPNRKTSPKNEEIRKLLSQNLTKARNSIQIN
jgi:hypothetical protein